MSPIAVRFAKNWNKEFSFYLLLFISEFESGSRIKRRISKPKKFQKIYQNLEKLETIRSKILQNLHYTYISNNRSDDIFDN